MAQISQAQTYTILRNLGWRIRTEREGTVCVRNFQRGYNLGGGLTVDGQVGPLTSAALLKSYARLKAGRGTASEHFSFTEFRCKCGARFDSCPRIWVYRGLLQSLEKLRATEGPMHITSGGRCLAYNRTIANAATHSQHTTGTAADIHLDITFGRLAAKHLFAGIGYAASSSQVRHVDRRDLVGSRSSRANPMIWRYSQW